MIGPVLGSRLIEPKYMEFISALAAGKRAELMMEITLDGITPLTIALAVATKQTGGQLICVGNEEYDIEKSKALVTRNSLENVIKIEYGNSCEVIKQYKNIDFAIIDCKFQDHLKIFKTLYLNPSRSTMVVNNFHHRRDGISFAEVVEGINCGVKCVTLPIGDEMDLQELGQLVSERSTRDTRDFM